ncbi:uncharacterized protein [Zea mays]|uniref:uncharacterized protein n=1 Tax=Zea mays TaxID=4577 RepID=UPI0009AABC99|nr:uncharacterized protein LOC103646919 [Zea mays]|eukprot:XP_020404907.1 uncharacterized protein LOC103646919 [Zea mays]
MASSFPAHGALPPRLNGVAEQQPPALLSPWRREQFPWPSSIPAGTPRSRRPLRSSSSRPPWCSTPLPFKCSSSIPLLPMAPPFLPWKNQQPPLCCCRAPAPASSHGAEDSLRASTSPISSTSVRAQQHPCAAPLLHLLPIFPTKQHPQRVAVAHGRAPFLPGRLAHCPGRPEIPAASSTADLRSKLRAAAACRVFAVLRSPIRDAVETRASRQSPFVAHACSIQDRSGAPRACTSQLRSRSGPRDGDRARDMVPTTGCRWWTTQGRMDLTTGC